MFLKDGEIRSKNHKSPQPCHQTSYQEIVERRGSSEFKMPCGGVVNDYVPFYFSPITSFTFTIYKGNVSLRSPDGAILGAACQDDRAFFVANVKSVFEKGLSAYFSSIALNSKDSAVSLSDSLERLGEVVNWSLFDDSPRKARIPEIGYDGVCEYFHNRDTPQANQNRSRERMAEFLIKDAAPLDVFECILVKDAAIQAKVNAMIAKSAFNIPVHVKPNCYYS